MAVSFPPPYTPLSHVQTQMCAHGYVALAPQTVATLACTHTQDLMQWMPAWNDLPPDTYLKDGGRYRYRRHSCFIAENRQLQQAPHRAHWQSLDYNALHGGMQRWFEPIDSTLIAQPEWSQLLLAIGEICTALSGVKRWYVEAHQFRIDTGDGIGRPTPEGAHRDGVDYVAVILLARQAIKGGETRVFEANGPQGQRFTLDQPWSLLLLDDARMIHETTPIQPVEENGGYRDTLVLTYRRGAFQGEE